MTDMEKDLLTKVLNYYQMFKPHIAAVMNGPDEIVYDRCRIVIEYMHLDTPQYKKLEAFIYQYNAGSIVLSYIYDEILHIEDSGKIYFNLEKFRYLLSHLIESTIGDATALAGDSFRKLLDDHDKKLKDGVDIAALDAETEKWLADFMTNVYKPELRKHWPTNEDLVEAVLKLNSEHREGE